MFICLCKNMKYIRRLSKAHYQIESSVDKCLHYLLSYKNSIYYFRKYKNLPFPVHKIKKLI